VYLGAVPADWRDRTSLAVRTVLSAPGIPWPGTIRRYEPFVAALREVRPESFDLIWAERPHIARLCAPLHERTILDLDDLEHVKLLRVMQLPQPPVERVKSIYRYLLYRHLEVSWAARFRAAIVCSEDDRRHLERRGCRNGFVVPNAPASNGSNGASAHRVRDRGGPLRVVFLGNVTHEPNVDAIDFFASQILPRLRARDPETTFDVIGPNASPEIRARYESRVTFRGFVEDLGTALGDYDLLLAPLRFGGGTKLKILDAMAHRIPIVTTAVGAEGLQLRHEQHALLAESAEALSDCVLRIKHDSELADRLTENAYAHVRANFSWDSIRGRLTEWLLQVA
jgi:glycosyltransferase involved in cell wall biosynthesis